MKRHNTDQPTLRKSVKEQGMLNQITKFMINNKTKNCATVTEIQKHLKCTRQTALKHLKVFTASGDLVRDNEVHDLFWLNTENF